MGYEHRPVMVREVVHYLGCRPGGIYVDGTVGGGGHGAAILEATGPDGVLIGIDRDEAAISEAREALSGFGARVVLMRGNFDEIDRVVQEAGYSAVDGLLLDLGVSSHQLDEAARGFSFSRSGPLDMRMDRRGGLSAREVVNTMDAEELADIIRRFGEERFAMRIARAIVREREKEPIETTKRLADIVEAAMPRRSHGERIHPATRTFQGLRIYVNRELNALEKGLSRGREILEKKGRMVVISYHSLEDRIVKRAFRAWASPCECPPGLPRCVCGKVPLARLITRKVVRPTETEVAGNPRARSARLRAVEIL